MYFTKKVIAEADQLLSVSSTLKIATNCIANPKKEIRVIYNGCDLSFFKRNKENRLKIRNKFGISERGKILIFVGRITEYKGIFELMTAFIKLNLKYPDMHLFIVGEGSGHVVIENMIHFDNSNKNIHILGKLPYSEIPKFLSAADIFILPSYSEGLPNVVLEAMACGLPVIATKVGGIPEAVEDGKSGILVDKKDVESLTGAIEYLIKSENTAKEMGINGRRIVENKFSWQRNAEEVIKIYEETISKVLCPQGVAF